MTRSVGIDIGSGSIKIVELEVRKGQARLLSAQKLRTTAFGEETPQAERLATTAREMKKLGRKKRAVVGFSGRDVILKYSRLGTTDYRKVPTFMDLELAELIERSGHDVLADYRLLHVPDLLGASLVLVALMKEGALTTRLEALAKGGVGIHSATATPLGLYNAYLSCADLKDGEVHLALDIGDQTTQAVLVKDGNLLFARNVGFGGAQFTKALLDLGAGDDKQAEAWKRESTVHPDHYGDSPRGRALKTVADAFGAQVQAAVQFAKAQMETPKLRLSRVFLAGDGARLRGMREHLMGVFGAMVEPLNPIANLDLDGLDDSARRALSPAEDGWPRAADFASAIGLARIGCDAQAFSLALVPESVRRRRDFMRHTVWLYAAGVLALAALSGATLLSAGHEAGAAALIGEAQQDSQRYTQSRRRLERAQEQGLEAKLRSLALHDAVHAPAGLLSAFDAVKAQAPPEVFFVSWRFSTSERGEGTIEILAFLEKKDRDIAQVDREFLEVMAKAPGVRHVTADRTLANPPGIRSEYGSVIRYQAFMARDPAWEALRAELTPDPPTPSRP